MQLISPGSEATWMHMNIMHLEFYGNWFLKSGNFVVANEVDPFLSKHKQNRTLMKFSTLNLNNFGMYKCRWFLQKVGGGGGEGSGQEREDMGTVCEGWNETAWFASWVGYF